MYDKIEDYDPKEKKVLAKIWFRFVDCFLVRNDVPFFGKIAKKIRCRMARHISKGIEKGAVIEKGAIIVPGVVCKAHGCIGIKCVTCWGLHIGKRTMMGPNCRFYSISHKRTSSGNCVFEGLEDPKPIYIGNDCWIGYNVVITGGVKIGDGVTIGASSVITRDVPDFCLAAGNPASVKKQYAIPYDYYDQSER